MGRPETSVTNNLRCVTSKKSEALKYTAAAAWSHACYTATHHCRNRLHTTPLITRAIKPSLAWHSGRNVNSGQAGTQPINAKPPGTDRLFPLYKREAQTLRLNVEHLADRPSNWTRTPDNQFNSMITILIVVFPCMLIITQLLFQQNAQVY
jgi:hypothetical protein